MVPDIHGCYITLRYVVDTILKPDRKDEIFFLGDFINKGPDSKKVLDYVMKLKKQGLDIHTIMGNHEKLLLNAINNPDRYDEFINKGGDSTLRSFGVNHVNDIPDRYIYFMEELCYFIELKEYMIVHAGFNFTSEDPFTDYNSMLTIRNFPVDINRINHKTIIHGHNASTLQDILETVMNGKSSVKNLDNGCVYTEREGMGNLFVLNLTNMSFHVQPCIDRKYPI